MNRIGSVIALGLVLAALVGCSASADTGASNSPSSGGGTTASTKTYTNDEYGFSITYGDRFTQGDPAKGTGAGGSSVFDLVFADKKGPVVSGRYVNAVQTSVYQLARTLKPSEVPQLKNELQGIVDQLMASLPGSKVVEKLSPVKINGVPGFALKYTYTESGTDLTAVTFFLFNGKYEYQLTAQATTKDWESTKGDLEAAVKSFTVK